MKFKKDQVINGVFVPVEDVGQPRVPRSRSTSTHVIALQQTPEGWKVRPFMTFWMHYYRFYGKEAGKQFERAYMMRLERLGLLKTHDEGYKQP